MEGQRPVIVAAWHHKSPKRSHRRGDHSRFRELMDNNARNPDSQPRELTGSIRMQFVFGELPPELPKRLDQQIEPFPTNKLPNESDACLAIMSYWKRKNRSIATIQSIENCLGREPKRPAKPGGRFAGHPSKVDRASQCQAEVEAPKALPEITAPPVVNHGNNRRSATLGNPDELVAFVDSPASHEPHVCSNALRFSSRTS
jgi:hypothetical protein